MVAHIRAGRRARNSHGLAQLNAFFFIAVAFQFVSQATGAFRSTDAIELTGAVFAGGAETAACNVGGVIGFKSTGAIRQLETAIARAKRKGCSFALLPC